MGRDGIGFKIIMYHFNHKRRVTVGNLIGQGRAALADTFLLRQRTIVGKSLINQPVIRNKLASAAAELESVPGDTAAR